MKALLSACAVLGLAVAFGLSEPAPASDQPLTFDDVRLVSEQLPDLQSETFGRNKSGIGRGRGSYCR